MGFRRQRSGRQRGDGGLRRAGLLRGLIGALPPLHELAEQAGIDLPAVLGKVQNPQAPTGGRRGPA